MQYVLVVIISAPSLRSTILSYVCAIQTPRSSRSNPTRIYSAVGAVVLGAEGAAASCWKSVCMMCGLYQ